MSIIKVSAIVLIVFGLLLLSMEYENPFFAVAALLVFIFFGSDSFDNKPPTSGAAPSM